MKKTILFSLIVVMLVFVGCNKGSQKEVVLETVKQKTSYAVGFNMGESLKDISARVELEPLLQGLRDSQDTEKDMLTKEEINKLYQEFMKETRKTINDKMKKIADKNKAEGEAFLAENAKKEGVVTIESGLQYQVLQKGTGQKPTMEDTVEIHYHGTLIDGTVFDSSVKRNQTATFPLKGVIKGFSEALSLMKEGAKYRIFLPSNLAYGAAGAGKVIGPNSVLIFELELIKVVKK